GRADGGRGAARPGGPHPAARRARPGPRAPRRPRAARPRARRPWLGDAECPERPALACGLTPVGAGCLCGSNAIIARAAVLSLALAMGMPRLWETEPRIPAVSPRLTAGMQDTLFFAEQRPPQPAAPGILALALPPRLGGRQPGDAPPRRPGPTSVLLARAQPPPQPWH